MTTTMPSVLEGYGAAVGTLDEMVDHNGVVRPHWSSLVRSLEELGVDELRRRQHEAARILDEDGVTYHAYEQAPHGLRSWVLDAVPVLIASSEWSIIEAGIAERAELLNVILDDLYGPRDLLRRGLIPPEIVFGHDGFLRPCDSVRLPRTQQLFSYCADLSRDPDGRWVVLADRTQTPSGFGYALENRTVTSRIFPSLYRDAQVHRLAPFFRSLRAALQEAAPAGVDDPRIVILTPGPLSETAFEHAFLASHLGYPLVEGSDLAVRGGQVWMRSLGHLEPVHVILRRVDGDFCDPLELRTDSKLGVAGLVEATRRGTVSVVNTLGSSVLENPALMAQLPSLADHLLGRPLQLASVPTWWCGDDDARRYVLAHLDELVLKPIARHPGANAVFGAELTSVELHSIRHRIQAAPHAWVGQQPATPSSVPTLGAAGLVPRPSILRAFAVSRRDSYSVLPGGLTRVAPRDGVGRISNQAGAISKDTWVLASEPERLTGFWLHAGPPVEAADPMASLSSRAAENLFWLGRYAERAEDTARLLRAVYDRRNDFQGSPTESGVEALRALLAALTHVTATYPGFVGDGAPSRLASPGPELYALVRDEARTGSLAHSIRRLLNTAYAVRDQLSNDTWLVVGALDREILVLRDPETDKQAAVQPILQRVMQSLLALAGLTGESMVRDLGWRFLDTGRRLERALQLTALLASTVTSRRGTATDSLVLESTLTAAESIITYRRRYRSHAQLETVLDLLLLDPDNPRSARFQLDRAADNLAALPASSPLRLREDEREVLEAVTMLRVADTPALAAADDRGHRGALEQFLGQLAGHLRRAGDAVDRAHFVHLRPQWSMSGLDDSGDEVARP